MKIFIKIIVYLVFSWVVVFVPSFLLRSGVVEIDYHISYIIIYVFYVIALLLVNRLMPVKKNYVWLSLPILLLTGYGLWVNYNQLFPFVFPTVTILFVLALLPFIFFKHRKKIVVVSLSTVVLYAFLIFPQAAAVRGVEKENIVISDSQELIFLDVAGEEYMIEPEGQFVIDCMFSYCPPCIRKLEYVKGLSRHVKVYVIMAGHLDTFEAFQKFYADNQDLLAGSTFLYDQDSRFMKKYNVGRYPTELVFDTDRIIAREVGGGLTDVDSYVKSRLKLLRQ